MQNKIFRKFNQLSILTRVSLLTTLTLCIITQNSPRLMAGLPVEMNGSFGVDTTHINYYRRTSNKVELPNSGGSTYIGTGNGLADGKASSFQNYIFRLNQTVMVNDAIMLHSEMSTGNARGGLLGDSHFKGAKIDNDSSFNNLLYLHHYNYGTADVIFNQVYATLYPDFATIKLGRHSQHWGLGAIYNSGKDDWDHFATIRDGISVEFNFSNFRFSPFWGKASHGGSLTKTTSTLTYGFSVEFDSTDRDLLLGVLISKQETGSFSKTPVSTRGADVKFTDFFLKKTFGKFDLAIEIPIMSGTFGDVYNSTDAGMKYKSTSFLGEFNYRFNDFWKVGLDAGLIKGDDAETGKFEGMYLHPNFQIAQILHRYNLLAIADTTENLYQSQLSNINYLKLHTSYHHDSWTWYLAAIYAAANKLPTKGKKGFDHQRGITYIANADQSKSLGVEFDFKAKYQWNDNFYLEGLVSLLAPGEYYKFVNDSNFELNTKSTLLLKAKGTITF